MSARKLVIYFELSHRRGDDHSGLQIGHSSTEAGELCVFILTADENKTGHQFTWMSRQRKFKCLHVLICVKKKKIEALFWFLCEDVQCFLVCGGLFCFLFLFFNESEFSSTCGMSLKEKICQAAQL